MPGGSRIGRTIVLGTLAAALGIWWLGRAYDIESSRLLGFLMASLLFVAAVIVFAVGGAALMRALRRRRSIGLLSKSNRPKVAEAARKDR